MSAPAHYDAYSGGWYGQNCDDASTSSSSYRPHHCVVRSSNRDTVTQRKDAHSGGLYVNHCVNWRNCSVLPHPFRSRSSILFQESISLYTFNWSLWFESWEFIMGRSGCYFISDWKPSAQWVGVTILKAWRTED